MDQANMWLGALLYQRSEDIYRMKGILSVQDMDERFVFQVTPLCHYFEIFILGTLYIIPNVGSF